MLTLLTPYSVELVQKEFTKQMMAQWAIAHSVVEMNIRMMTTQLTWGYPRYYAAWWC